MKKLFIGALLCISSITYAQVPQFKDYPATVYSGKPSKLLINNETARQFKTRLAASLTRKPVFAGEYVLATWGCGTSCVSNNFVNKRTGQVIDTEFGGEIGDKILKYKLDSKLLITRGSIFDNDFNEIGSTTNFYVIENGKLNLVKKNS